MADCYKYLSKDIGADCNALIQPGVEQKAVIINRADIDMTNVTYDGTNPKIITALPLLSTKKGFAAVVPGATPFTGVGSELQVGTYVNTWNNTVPVVVFDNGPEVANKVIEPRRVQMTSTLRRLPAVGRLHLPSHAPRIPRCS